jgi:ABC-type transport system involved in multi-copper enzyme maturation permease subunit
MPGPPTWLMLRDEMVGFARSRVMLVLWIVLPLVTTVGYLVLPDRAVDSMMPGAQLGATDFMALMISSVAGTVAALLVGVDIVSERNRKVYDLFVIRPIRREVILWAKFIAVTISVSVACIVALALGLTVDAVRGAPVGGDTILAALDSLGSLVAVIALSAGVGVFFGVVSRSILVAVILILYLGQNLAVVPMLPVWLGVLPDRFWLFMAISAALTLVMVWLGGVIFRRSEL